MEEDIPFIIYNNRSVGGVVTNFLPTIKLPWDELSELEKRFAWCDAAFDYCKTVTIPEADLNRDYDDIRYGPGDLEPCSDLISQSFAKLLDPSTDGELSDRVWLERRGIGEHYIGKYFLGSLSYIVGNATPRQLDVLGITCHPMLNNILDDDLTGGGIVIPLFRDGQLANVTVRRISDVGKLKYTQSCPDMHVWGLDDLSEHHPTWMVEGLFDMMAVNESVSPYSSVCVRQAVSVSGAMWSVPQLMQLMAKSGPYINILADNDKVGLRSAGVLQRFLSMCGFTVRVYVSTGAKDACEHFLEMGLSWDEMEEIRVTREMIELKEEMSFNFLKYLKNRKF